MSNARPPLPSLHALIFWLTRLDTDMPPVPRHRRTLGFALICPEARYASIVWGTGCTQRIERPWVWGPDWEFFAARCQEPFLPKTPFTPTDIVPVMLLPADRRASVAVQFLFWIPIAPAPNAPATQVERLLDVVLTRKSPRARVLPFPRDAASGAPMARMDLTRCGGRPTALTFPEQRGVMSKT